MTPSQLGREVEVHECCHEEQGSHGLKAELANSLQAHEAELSAAVKATEQFVAAREALNAARARAVAAERRARKAA